jgi:hypothetical protein
MALQNLQQYGCQAGNKLKGKMSMEKARPVKSTEIYLKLK